MRLLLLAAIAWPAYAQDATDIVRRYSENAASQNERTRDYTYHEHVTKRMLGPLGLVKSEETDDYEDLIVDGKRVRRLVERNGRPVTEKDAARRQRQFDRAARRYPPVPLEDRFDRFDLEGEEEVNGRMAWVVTAQKKADRSLVLAYGSLTQSVKVWIDQSEFEAARIQSEGTGSVTGVSGRAHSLNSSVTEYTRIAEGVWLPARTVLRAYADAPVGPFPLSNGARVKASLESEIVYSDYKKFNADSRILEMPAKHR